MGSNRGDKGRLNLVIKLDLFIMCMLIAIIDSSIPEQGRVIVQFFK